MEDFVKLVKSMRDAQKAYFKNRQDADLKLSKHLERQVDEWIKSTGTKQTDLFPNVQKPG